MGLIRGGSVFFLGILLFFSFLAMNSFAILSLSLNYDNVKENLYPLIQNISGTQAQQLIPEELIGDFNLTKASKDYLNRARDYCSKNNNTFYNFSYQGYAINISCQDILNTTAEAFIEETYDAAIYDIYYKEYDCNFWNCFSTTGLPFFLVSQKAQDYWQNKFFISIVVSLILIVLILLFAEQKQNTPIIVGILLVFSALPLLKLGDLLYSIAGKFFAFLSIFLNSTKSVFLFSLIIGLLLVGTGIALRVWGWETGRIKEKLSKSEVKEIVKEEIKKETQTKQQARKKKK